MNISTLDRRHLFTPCGLLLAVLVVFAANSPLAMGDEADTKEKAKESAGKESETKDGDVLLDQIQQLNRKRPKGETREEKIESYRKIQWEIVETARKLYDLSHDDEEDGMTYAAVSVQLTVRSLRTLQQLGDDTAKERLDDFVALIAKDKREQVSGFAKQLALELKFEFPFDAKEEDVKKIAQLLKEEFGEGEIEPRAVGFVMQVLSRVEQTGHTGAALDLNQFFAKRFAKSDDEEIAEVAERLAGAVRRLDLPGNPIKVSGVFMDGSEIDWETYRGKVVLLDYWATWCGPCIAELPNLLEHYEIYHDRGFEVVGISVDEDREAVEEFVNERKLPWKTMFGDKPEHTGWNHPMARYYGIGGIPTVILVDREGKVVSLNARGEELARLLAELIGPPEAADAQQKEAKKAG